MNCTTTNIVSPTFAVPIVASGDARQRDFRHVHKQLGTLAAILRLHVTSTDMVDPNVRAHHAVMRARCIVCEALDRMEGK